MDKRPTRRQLVVLRRLSHATSATSARELGVRSDVLWRMQERGWVTRNIHQQWRIRPAGTEALEAETARRAAAGPLIGYLVDGNVWHPSDVTIIRESAASSANRNTED